ncbi:MAG: PhoH family protein, partial [Candidatus Brocadiales bacterium]|nr:PhoH family protein [Candidatus Brocadiales bacterium]
MAEDTNQTIQNTISLKSDSEARLLFGSHDKYLRMLRDAFNVQIVARNGILKLEGKKEQVEKCTEGFDYLLEIIRKGRHLKQEEVEKIIAKLVSPSLEESGEEGGEPTILPQPQAIEVFLKGITIQPRTEGQASYVQAIRKHDLVFCIGPAGTGKTYLAVAMALSALKAGTLRKIILARPAVEAGEKLGFLPGDIQAKVNPYLRPLYDALADMMEFAQVRKYLEGDIIEILPLAFMRGRTLNDAFIILDEAQNCTIKQMKTFLTRLGVKSKVVVTGDITQVDLPSGEISGLADVQERLRGVNGISFI